MKAIDGRICSSVVDGRELSFFVQNPDDIIQAAHTQCHFYERDELEIIRQFFPVGGVYVDIGANVGNHLIFVCRYLFPSQAVVFEPNPDAIDILRINIALNGLQRVVDQSCLGFGLSNGPGRARLQVSENNLGATILIPSDEGGAVRLAGGDETLLHRRVDFLKIAVEGMEMAVLEGLAATIYAWRPAMFVKVDHGNAEAFHRWAKTARYTVIRSFRRYQHNENIMIAPTESLTQPG